MNAMQTFLPVDYVEPVSNKQGYLKHKDGDQKVRILSSAITGYEYFNTSDKPIRQKEAFNPIPTDIKVNQYGKKNISHFWACVVWNYDEECIQIWQISQKKIMTQLKEYISDEDYGDPKQYDIKINRTGKDKETTYTIKPLPPKEFEDKKIIEKAGRVNLQALYSGENPFANMEVNITEDLF